MHRYACQVHLLQIHSSNFAASDSQCIPSRNFPEARTHGMQQLAMVNGQLPQMTSTAIEHSTVTVRDVHKILESDVGPPQKDDNRSK